MNTKPPILPPLDDLRWNQAVAALTCDVRPGVSVAHACYIWGAAWKDFGDLLREWGLDSLALALKADTDNDPHRVVVELFHHAAQGASQADFERVFAYLANGRELRLCKHYVHRLAEQIRAAAPARDPAAQPEPDWVKPLRDLRRQVLAHPEYFEDPADLGDDAEILPDTADQLPWAAKAVGLIAANPQLTATQIAEAVGVHRSTLYRHPTVKNALNHSRASIKDLPCGFRNGRRGNIEAYREEDDE